MRNLEPARRIHAWRTYLAMWTLHRVLGLVFGALILLLSVTGGVLVVYHDVERLIERDRHVLTVPAEDARVALTPLVRRVAAELAPEGYRPFRLMPARAPDETGKLMFLAPDGRTRWSAMVNPYSGEVLWHGADQALFTPWLLGLHMNLQGGRWGYVVTGLAGVGLFLLGLSGLYIHRDGLRTLWQRPMRLNRGWRTAWTDLHKWVGLASLYFCLILGLTGALYCAKIIPGQFAAPATPRAAFDLAQLTDLEPVIAAARTRFPDSELLRVSLPTSATAPLTTLLLHRDAPVWRKFSRIDFDPATGAVRTIKDAAAASMSEKFSGMLAPLHFGFYGSPVVKWLYVVGGFTPAILAVSGVAIWILRRRANGRERSSRRLTRPLEPAVAGQGGPRVAEPEAERPCHSDIRTSAH